jgi:hypothetical protein
MGFLPLHGRGLTTYCTWVDVYVSLSYVNHRAAPPPPSILLYTATLLFGSTQSGCTLVLVVSTGNGDVSFPFPLLLPGCRRASHAWACLADFSSSADGIRLRIIPLALSRLPTGTKTDCFFPLLIRPSYAYLFPPCSCIPACLIQSQDRSTGSSCMPHTRAKLSAAGCMGDNPHILRPVP